MATVRNGGIALSKVIIELTERMEQDRKNCCEDLCTSEECTLWMENADICLLELVKGE